MAHRSQSTSSRRAPLPYVPTDAEKPLPASSKTSSTTRTASAAAASPRATSDAEQLLLPFVPMLELEAGAVRTSRAAKPQALGTGVLLPHAAVSPTEATSRGANDAVSDDVYSFVPLHGCTLRVGQRVQCTAQNAAFDGEVRTVSPTVEVSVRRCTAGSLGSTLRNVVAVDDSAAWIVERLITQIRRVVAGEVAWDGRFARAVLEPDGYRALPAPQPLTGGQPLDFSMVLDESQLEAVTSALSRPMTVLVGPPGTGKSTVIGAIVRQLLACDPDHRVLVFAPSNGACDVLVRAIARWFMHPEFTHPMIGRGVLQRAGHRPTEYLDHALRELVIPTQIRKRIERDTDEVMETAEERRQEAHGAGDEQEVAAFEELLVSLTRERACLGEEIACNRRVTVAPLTSSYLERDIWDSRDETRTVIVDETSLASPAMVAYAAGLVRGRGRLILVGDPRQLPPVVASRDPRVPPVLGRCVMQYMGVDRALGADGAEDATGGATTLPHVVILTETYRLSPAVTSALSPVFYGNRLRTAVTRIRRAREALRDALAPLIVIDTSGYRATALTVADLVGAASGGAQDHREDAPRGNLDHADVTHQLLVRLGERTDAGTLRVAVISLYHAQLAVLRHIVRSLRWSDTTEPAITATQTVHKSQGWEEEVVVVDLATLPHFAQNGFLHRSDVAKTGARLVNVALSRARGSLIVIADLTDLRRSGTSEVWTAVGACVRAGVLIRAADVRTAPILD